VLIAGKTGSGKSTLMHILITNLALYYSPQEIQFYLIDFKKGVEFRAYAACGLPHARVIAIESDREFGLSVLERLDAILQERGELFRQRGVQDVPSFRREFPREVLPRLLLLIDEFQEFFTSEDRVSSRSALLLDRLIRQGRAFGIHAVLGSQTLGGRIFARPQYFGPGGHSDRTAVQRKRRTSDSQRGQLRRQTSSAGLARRSATTQME
jgi:DNA segregation ATPase FtsK/SpoIIIE-like protein